MQPFEHLPTDEALTAHELSDEALLAGARARLDRAIDVLHKRYAAQLLPLAARYAPDDAQSVVNDVFLALPQHLERYTHQGRLLPWLRTLVVHRAQSVGRDARRRAGRETSLLDAEATMAAESDGDPGITLAELEATLPHVLGPRAAAVLLLEFAGWRHEEIGRLLGITAANSQQVASRGRRRMHVLRERFHAALQRVRAGRAPGAGEAGPGRDDGVSGSDGSRHC